MTEMYLNAFAPTTAALDMTASDEFASLLASARDLGLPVPDTPRYASANVVLRHHRFHYLDWGAPAAPPIVILHGSNQSAHSWDLVSLALAAEHRVLALDQRGHGDSEWCRGAHYGIDVMADDAGEFIGAQKVASPVLIGHSMGGMVAMAHAVQRSETLRALIVVDMGPEVNDRGRKMIREFVGRNVEFDDMEAFLDRVEKYDPYRSREHIRRTLKYNLLRRADGRYVSKADRRRYPSADGAVPGVPPVDALAALEIPILIVRGADSNVLEQDAAERFAAALPSARLVVVPDCGHNVAQQNTPGFLAALNEFLAAL